MFEHAMIFSYFFKRFGCAAFGDLFAVFVTAMGQLPAAGCACAGACPGEVESGSPTRTCAQYWNLQREPARFGSLDLA
jgi:hypothetical protein